jgi:pimeloyl-ACP methyl ester carboxylesterase
MLKIVLTGAAAVVIVLAVALVIGFVWEKIAEARDARRFPPPGRLVDIGGRRLHILCRGEAPGPTIVIEQGTLSPSVFWRPVMDRLATQARVCVYDRAGYAWSDPGPLVRSLDERVEDLHRLLRNAKVPGPYVLVGHSYGGPLVRMFARTHPDEVAGMVLVDTPEEAVVFRKAYVDYTRGIEQFLGFGKLASRFGVARLLMMLVSHPEGAVTPEMNSEMIAFMSRPSFFDAARDEPASVYRAEAETRRAGGFGALGARPLSVITHTKPFPGPAASMEDGWAEGQKRLAGLSTDSELIAATQSNHMIPIEEPDLVADAISRVYRAARDGHRLSPAPSPTTKLSELAG